MTDLPNRLLQRTAPDQLRDPPLVHQPGEADALSDVLSCVRLTGSMLFLVDASSPWMSHAPAADLIAREVLPRAQHLVSYHVVTEGRCWGGLLGSQPQPLATGDVLVVPHGAPYFLADPPDAKASYDVDEAIGFFRDMAAGRLSSIVSEGSGGRKKTQFICGFLACDARPFNPILTALPPVFYLRRSAAAEHMAPLVEFALSELRQRGAGSKDVLLRLSELMFVAAVRWYLETIPDVQDGWLVGLRDPVVGKALGLIHASPGHDWTLDVLSERIGTSRSVLVERFTQIIGRPPMQYLTAWRMQRATRMLADRASKVAAVAQAVGYDSEAAFSRAFKKVLGVSPSRWREGCR